MDEQTKLSIVPNKSEAKAEMAAVEAAKEAAKNSETPEPETIAFGRPEVLLSTFAASAAMSSRPPP